MPIDDAIEMFELFVPPFTRNASEIRARSRDYRRFTMADIGKINQRVTNLERVTNTIIIRKRYTNITSFRCRWFR